MMPIKDIAGVVPPSTYESKHKVDEELFGFVLGDILEHYDEDSKMWTQ
jgi:hypothetical protein